MNLIIESPFDTPKDTYDHIENGTVFASFDRDCADLKPAILMKCVDDSGRVPVKYIVDLETGELYSDVYNYPIDKIIDQDFGIDLVD